MNVRAVGRIAAALLCVAGLSMSGPSRAQGVADAWDKFRDDPLLAQPPVLSSGTVLPGDAAPVGCPAAYPTDQPLALADAVDIALCANPQVRSAWAAIKVQAGALGEAKAAYWPTLNAAVSRVHDRTGYPGSGQPDTALSDSAANAGVSWRLFDFGTREANRNAAADLLDAALANHDAALQKTLAGVIQAYFDAETAQSAWEAKQRSEALARDTLAVAQRREQRGAGARSDTLQAATALAKASLERSRADGDYRKAVALLVYLLGLPAESQLHLAPNFADDGGGELSESLSQWLEQAQRQHPAIRAAVAQLEAAQEKVKASVAEGLPTIDVAANAYRNGRPNQGLPPTRTVETVAAVTLNIPLFEGFARTYKIRGAQAQVEQRQAELQDTQNQVLLEVVRAHADATSALANLEASRKLLQTAQDALASVRRRFDRGAADILEMLSSQAAASEASQERIRSLAEWRSAKLRLRAAAGRLGRLGVR